MLWKIINEEYTDFLRNNYESRIPNTDYGEDKYKPFFGDLFQIGSLVYVTQVTSPKPRHNTLKQSIDFYKIYIDNRLTACVNLNYMFPVPVNELSNLRYSEIGNIIKFNSELQKNKYIKLLKSELREINRLNLEQAAQNLHKRKYDRPNDKISQRCFDFLKLEEGAQEWIKSQKAKTLTDTVNSER